MKFNFEQPNKENSRRAFLKKLTILGASLFFNSTKIPELKQEKDIETQETICINKREVWDTKWPEIKKQYEIPLGQEFHINIKGKDYKKYASAFSYIEHENKTLKEVFKRIVIHHSALDSEKNTLEEIEGLRNFQIGERGFDDIAYHFLISKNGEIFEGRPLDRLGSHAGFTKESLDYFKEHLPEKAKDLKPQNPNYEQRLNYYLKALKQKPDYGSIGIVILGNFEGDHNPTELQLASLKKILNLLKTDYDIPKDNIIFHKEVKEKVVEASGLHLASPVTVCPGKNLESNFSKVREGLVPDTENALCKDILLEK